MSKIWVVPTNKNRIGIHEYDTAHITNDNPQGLLDISPCSVSGKGMEPREVEATPGVYRAIHERRLREVPKPSREELAAMKKEKAEK